jgi:quercetin dioxygenase-like cupin family protein
MEVAAPRDAGPPPHSHSWDEGFYVLDGELRVSLYGREQILSAGDFLYIPGGTLHGFAGASDVATRVLIFAAPPHADDFFRDAHREVRELPRDLEKVPEIGERHGIHFARPGSGG